MRDDLQSFKSQPITQMADKLGLAHTERNGKSIANCPFCGDNSGHLYLYQDTNRYHCFKCQASGDAIDLATKGYNYSIHSLKNLFGYTNSTYRDAPPKTLPQCAVGTHQEANQKPKAVANTEGRDHSDIYFEITATLQLSDKGRDYLHHRGLTDKIIDRYDLRSIDDPKEISKSLMERYSLDTLLDSGIFDYSAKGKLYFAFFMPAILFTHWDMNFSKITGLSTRNIAGDTKGFKLHGKNTALYYGQHAAKAPEIYVFEGIINALSYAVITGRDNFIATSGLISPAKYQELAMAHPNQKLILGLDPDEAGQKALAQITKCSYINWTQFAIQMGHKSLQHHANGKAWDINDYLIHKGV